MTSQVTFFHRNFFSAYSLVWTCFSWWLTLRIPKKQTIIKVTKESFRGATMGRHRGRGQFWKCAGSFLGRWEFLPNWRKTLVQKERVDCGTSWKFAGTTLFRARRTSIPRMSRLEVSYEVTYRWTSGKLGSNISSQAPPDPPSQNLCLEICTKASSLHSSGGTLPQCWWP